MGSLQEALDWTIFYKEGLADVARGRIEKAVGLFDKVLNIGHWMLQYLIFIHMKLNI